MTRASTAVAPLGPQISGLMSRASMSWPELAGELGPLLPARSAGRPDTGLSGSRSIGHHR
jgi:hypothetical protein